MKGSILYIDDEFENLESFRLAFWKYYDIELALSTHEAEEKLMKKTFQIVISDQKMAHETGLDFIKRIRPQYPRVVYILLTAYSEMNIVINAINVGVYRYIQKPWMYNEMKMTIDNAMEKYLLSKKNEELLYELRTKNAMLENSIYELTNNTVKLKQSQKELAYNENLLSTIYKNLTSVVAIVDKNFKILKINRTAKLLANKEEKEIVGKYLGQAFNCINYQIAYNNSGYGEMCTNCFISNTLSQCFKKKTDIYKKEGQFSIKYNGELIIKTILISATYLKQEQPLVLLSIDDITRQKENEKQLQIQNKKLENLNEQLSEAIMRAKDSERLKSAIISNISHEVRTPMNAIVGFSEMLAKKEITQTKKNVFASIVKDSSMRLLRVIDNIIAISQLEFDELDVIEEEVCINDLIMEIYFLFIKQANRKNIELIMEKPIPDNESYTMTDKLRLVQIFNNLIDNAIKFTPTGKVEFGYSLEKSYFKFFVKDNGIGIESKMQKKVFEGFYQVEMDTSKKFEGIGAGLSISKKLCELLGGSMWLESETGKGSTFYFTIPYKEMNIKDHERHNSIHR